MIRAVFRGILAAVCGLSLCSAVTLDEAVGTLAKKVGPHLLAGESVKVASRNLSTLPEAEVVQARELMQKLLRRPARRGVQPVLVTLTLSENLRGHLLIAEISRGEERRVELVNYQIETQEQRSPALLEKRLLWEQPTPILDVASLGDRMLVLDPAAVTLYARGETGWERIASRHLPPDIAVLTRDPRGRLEISGDSLVVHLPGGVCRGTWQPSLELSCEPATVGFLMGGILARFASGRNTLEAEGRPPFYSGVRLEGKGSSLDLYSELDGRVRLYKDAAELAGVIETWGADFVLPGNVCGSAGRLLTTGAGDYDRHDSLTLYEIVEGKPRALSEPLDLNGPVTALWPAPEGAVAVVRSLPAETYEAYNVAVDCGR